MSLQIWSAARLAAIDDPAPEANPPDYSWHKNPLWPALVQPATEKVSLLFAVRHIGGDPSAVSIVCSGNYTVDWGDGSTPDNTAAASPTDHFYQYSDTDLNGSEAPCTVATNTVTKTAHGLSNGDEQTIYTTEGVIDSSGYVINTTANTFQLSATAGGSALTLPTGSYQLLPYKIAVVTITAQGGATLTSVKLNNTPAGGYAAAYYPGWLEIRPHLPNLTAILNLERSSICEYINCSSLGSMTVINYFCRYNHNLVEVVLPSGFTPTGCLSAFNYCGNLLRGPEMDTSNIVNFTHIFNGCVNLLYSPGYDLSSCISTVNAYYLCSSMTTGPALQNSNLVVSWGSCFSQCTSLTTLPLFSIQGKCMSMFAYSKALKKLPPIDWSGVTNLYLAFRETLALKYVPNSGAAPTIDNAASRLGLIFYSNDSMERWPWTDMVLPSVGLDRLFLGSKNLREFVVADASGVTTAPNNPFSTCTNLEKVRLPGLALSLTILNCSLEVEALVDLFGDLATAVGQTITITGNPGAAGLSAAQRDIAQDKGWTIIG